MKTLPANRKYFVLILAAILIGFGTQGSYGQTITASVQQPLTEANLHGSVVTLTLSGGTYERSSFRIRDAVMVSGIDGVTVGTFGVDRASDTEVTVELEFTSNIDANGTLTFTVGAGAIAGYSGNAFTVQLPVAALEESLVASTESPLTEANLHGSVVTLTLSGRNYEQWIPSDTVTASGIDGVAISDSYDGVRRVSDTEVTVELAFNGDFDTDATLTLTIGADAIVGYNKDFTVQVSVTAIEQSNATVSVSPASVQSPDVGEELTLSLNIANGVNVAGYQAIVLFDRTAFRLVNFTEGNYLPADAFFADPTVIYGGLGGSASSSQVTLAANTLAEPSNGDGTLVTLTFKVIDFKASTLTLSQVYLVDADGKRWEATTESGQVTEPPEPAEEVLGDINRDGVVNIQDLAIVGARFGQRGQNRADVNGDGLVDIVDLVLVAIEFGGEAAAPSAHPQALGLLTAAEVRQWLSQAHQLALTDPTYLRGITGIGTTPCSVNPARDYPVAKLPESV